MQVFISRNLKNSSIYKGNKFYCISNYCRHELNLPASNSSITKYGYELTEKEVRNCLNSIFNDTEGNKTPELPVYSYKLKQQILAISKMVTELDDLILDYNGLGWIGGGALPNLQQVLLTELDSSLRKTFKVLRNKINGSVR